MFSQLNEAFKHLDSEDYESCIGSLNQLLIENGPDPSVKSAASILKRDVYFDLRSYSKAIEIHETIDWTNLPDYWESKVPGHFIARVNFETGNFDEAIREFKVSIDKLNEANLTVESNKAELSLSRAFRLSKKMDSASQILDNLEKYISDKQSLKHDVRLEKGSIFYDHGEYLKAIPIFKADTAIRLAQMSEIEQVQKGISSVLQLAAAFIQVEQFRLARKTLSRAEQLLNIYPDPELYQILLRYQVRFYEGINELDSAHALTKGYVAMWDLLLQHRAREKSRAQQIAFRSILQEERLTQANLQTEVLAEEQVKRTRLLIIVGVVLLVGSLVILMVYLFYRRLLKDEAKLKNASEQLAVKTIELDKTLHEKEVLMREVHHRVKNNLQMISSLFFIQSKNVSDPIAKSVINEGQARVQAMASIHQKLYDSDTLDEINMKSHLNALCQQIISSYAPSDKSITFDLETEEIKLNVDKALPISLIVNELISNSMKHAFNNSKQGQINVKISVEDDEIKLSYSDSGEGFQTEQNSNDSGIGLRLIELLSSQLKASKHRHQEDGSYVINIPLE